MIEKSISSWLAEAAEALKINSIESARLDAEIILAHTLKKSRTWLHAHGDEELDPRLVEIADTRIALRKDRTPVAYIVGHKEFYGRTFKVTPATLIPRPESEAVITLLGQYLERFLTPIAPEHIRIIDVGTGSGCLGITAKLEWPALTVTLTDKSPQALAIAKENATALNADVSYFRGDLLRGFGDSADCIIANLPYVDRSWEVSPDTRAEPDMALYAQHEGLALINTLIAQSSAILPVGGALILESDPRQHDAIIEETARYGLSHEATDGFITLFVRR